MSEREQNKPLGETARVLRCDEWENLLADAVDGTLNAADAAAFTRHHRECALVPRCSKRPSRAGRGWNTWPRNRKSPLTCSKRFLPAPAVARRRESLPPHSRCPRAPPGTG